MASKEPLLSEERELEKEPVFPPADICVPWDSPRAFIKWAFPCFIVGFGGYIGSAGLHYASYNYVHEIDAWTAWNAQFETQHDRDMAVWIEGNFSRNRDPVASWFGPPELIPMGILDKIAMVFPAVFCILILVTKRVELWTKIMVCTALLAATKGIIGAVTTVPDSSGWDVCRNRLQQSGYDWLSQDLTFFQIVTVDFWWFPTYGHPLRYCSDMMFSGHTFFVTLYALGLYEVAHIWTATFKTMAFFKKMDKTGKKLMWWCEPGAQAVARSLVLGAVSWIAIFQQMFEIYYVLLSRFHYTSDVVVALLFTFLFYTNGAVSIFAKQWAMRDLHFLTSGHLLPSFYLRQVNVSWKDFCRRDRKDEHLKRWKEVTEDEPEKGAAAGKTKRLYHLDKVTRQHKLCGLAFSPVPGIENPPYIGHGGECLVCKKVFWKCKCKDQFPDKAFRSKLKARSSQSVWLSRGDIFLPVCCVPFCCLAGREHVYSDRGIDRFKEMVNQDDDEGNDVTNEVIEQMHMHEGINAKDMLLMSSWLSTKPGCGFLTKIHKCALSDKPVEDVSDKLSPWARMHEKWLDHLKANPKLKAKVEAKDNEAQIAAMS